MLAQLPLGMPQSHKLLKPNVPASFDMHRNSYQTNFCSSASKHWDRPFISYAPSGCLQHTVAARLMILRNWKSALAHNISDVERMVDHTHAFECILVMNCMKHEAFSKSWSVWTSRRKASSGLSSLLLEMCNSLPLSIILQCSVFCCIPCLNYVCV